MEEHAQTSEQEIREVRTEVRRRFDLDHQRQRTAPDRRQQLLAGLDRSLRPAVLL